LASTTKEAIEKAGGTGLVTNRASARARASYGVSLRTRRAAIVEREDVDAIFGVLFDIRRELADIGRLLEDDGEEEEKTEPEL
jgi:hypothetical protein